MALLGSCLTSYPQGWDVVMYGDTLVERLRGTQNGGAVNLTGFKEVWDSHMGSRKAAALGITGGHCWLILDEAGEVLQPAPY